MINHAVVFIVIALLAGVLWFSGIAGAAAGATRIAFLIFVVLFVVLLVMVKRKRL